jgi:hypothetical protein
MLFDLRGGGRRKVVQVTYVFLAVLIGGGLVLFGIGGSVSGGLVDAITGSSGTSTGNAPYEKRVNQTLAATRAHPQSASAWADLARARFQLASTSDNLDQANGTWTASGKKVLAGAAAAWQQHLKLAGNKPDDGVAGLMVQAYSSVGLNQPQKAVDAQEVITEARPTSATFANLAILAYQAGNTRTGDLAAKKALSLSDKDLRANLKSQLDAARKQSAAAAGATTATPTPTPTPAAKKGSKKKSGG